MGQVLLPLKLTSEKIHQTQKQNKGIKGCVCPSYLNYTLSKDFQIKNSKDKEIVIRE